MEIFYKMSRPIALQEFRKKILLLGLHLAPFMIPLVNMHAKPGH